MQLSLKLMTKKAVEAALLKEWDTAVELNELILAKNPKDKDTKIRLGRAYIKTEKFTKAKKIFKEILEIDPINQIALKNYKLAAEKNSDRKTGGALVKNAKNLVKEPGTTLEIRLPNVKKLKVLQSLEPGAELGVKIYKAHLLIYTETRTGKIEDIGTVDGETAKKAYKAKSEGIRIAANFIKESEGKTYIMLKSNKPIFKSPKQHEKPYMKMGSLDEPELEIEEIEE